MRIFILSLGLLLGACVPPKGKISRVTECHYSTLGDVADEPNKANGKMFCSQLYSYSKHGFLAFYDRPVRDTTEALERAALLIGDKDAKLNFKTSYPLDGERVNVRGVLRLQLSCFTGEQNSCVPVAKPIYMSKPIFSAVIK